MKKKASKKTKTKNVQRKLHCRLQKEFNWKILTTKKYLDNVKKENLEKLKKSNMEKRKRNEIKKLKRIKIQKQNEL